MQVSVVDVASIEGFWKSIRHGLRHYPAVVVAGSEKFVGTDLAAADRVIDRQLAAGTDPVRPGRKGAV